jgi:hypothetical protein
VLLLRSGTVGEIFVDGDTASRDTANGKVID